MGKITMKQLAEKVGVSTSTVSKAIRYSPLVNVETRERILQAAKEYNYVYNAAAADLRNNQSTIIGVLVPTIENYLVSRSIVAAQKTLPDNFSLIIGNTDYNPDEEKRLLIKFMERNLSGIIICGYSIHNKALIDEIIDQNIPCVVNFEVLDRDDISYVGIDNFKAAYRATKALIQLQHQRIGLIIGRYNLIGRIMKRFKGYQAALIEHGIEFDPSMVLERKPSYFEGNQAIRQLLSSPNPPTAVFIPSDEMAIGAISGAKAMGLKVPQDISIIGFDGIKPTAYTDPPLSTVKIPAYEIGKKSGEVLAELISNQDAGVLQYELETEMVTRESCRSFRA